MAPSRRQSNGRSPLVNPQRQITSFFSKSSTPSPFPLCEQKPNPNATSDLPNPNPNKPLLLIGDSSPSTTTKTSSFSSKKSYGQEIVGKRIKVYRSSDKGWEEGCVKSFDEINHKHLFQYDDADEELLDLDREKIQLIEENVKKLKRLRRGYSSLKQSAAMEQELAENVGKVDEEKGDNDESIDEDWGKKGGAKEEEDADELDGKRVGSGWKRRIAKKSKGG